MPVLLSHLQKIHLKNLDDKFAGFLHKLYKWLLLLSPSNSESNSSTQKKAPSAWKYQLHSFATLTNLM